MFKSFFLFSSRRRHTIWPRDWSSDVCTSDLGWSRSRVIRSPGRMSGSPGGLIRSPGDQISVAACNGTPVRCDASCTCSLMRDRKSVVEGENDKHFDYGNMIENINTHKYSVIR